MIRFENLTLGYGSRTLIDSLTASVSQGELTALVGRNGTGKSTLLRAIAGLEQTLGGEIFIGERPLADLTAAERASTIAFVTTEKVRIANLRSRDVVALGRAPYTNWIGQMQKQDEEIVMQSIAAVGMSDYADKTMDRMSDGECQRIMIARALAQQTPIILLDEPTAFLDMPNRYELCTLLRRLAREENKCILFSTHELDIALELCDSIALIAPPQLHILPTAKMVTSGHIERLFTGGIVNFDPKTRSVSVK
ncbi:MAG: ABC transporter ATP-binding protein [Alistipes sp.]|nr:ABC transporter ATP-binding protein [Alistipes sp.]